MVTPKQARILEFVIRYRNTHGYSPTLEDIALETGTSKATAQGHVRRLRRMKLLARDGKSRRSLKLTEAARRIVGPDVDPTGAATVIALPKNAPQARRTSKAGLSARKPSRFFEVRSDGLRGAGVLPGDVLIATKPDAAGEKRLVIVARPDGALNVQRFPADGLSSGGDAAAALVAVVIGLFRDLDGPPGEIGAELDDRLTS